MKTDFTVTTIPSEFPGSYHLIISRDSESLEYRDLSRQAIYELVSSALADSLNALSGESWT